MNNQRHSMAALSLALILAATMLLLTGCASKDQPLQGQNGGTYYTGPMQKNAGPKEPK